MKTDKEVAHVPDPMQVAAVDDICNIMQSIMGGYESPCYSASSPGQGKDCAFFSLSKKKRHYRPLGDTMLAINRVFYIAGRAGLHCELEMDEETGDVLLYVDAICPHCEHDHDDQLMDMSKEITVICKIHGEFTVMPQAHLDGEGCPKCDALQKN